MAYVSFNQYGSNLDNNGDEEFNKWIVMCSSDHNVIFGNTNDFTDTSSTECNCITNIPKASSIKIKIIGYHCGKKEELRTLEIPKPNMFTATRHEQTKRVDAIKPVTKPPVVLKPETKGDVELEKTQEVAPVNPPVMPPAVRRANMENAPSLNDDIQMCTVGNYTPKYNNINNKASAVLKPNNEMTLGHKEQQNIVSAKPMRLPPMQKSQPSGQPLEDRPKSYQKQTFTIDKKRKQVSVTDAYESRLEATKQKLQDSYQHIKEAKKQKAIKVIEFQKPVELRKSKTKPNVKTSISKKLLAMRTHNKCNKFHPLDY